MRYIIVKHIIYCGEFDKEYKFFRSIVYMTSDLDSAAKKLKDLRISAIEESKWKNNENDIYNVEYKMYTVNEDKDINIAIK